MKRHILLLLLLLLLGVNAYAVPINLGTASTFGLLAGSGVTNTGSSVINGDVGSSPLPAVTGFPPGMVNGTLYTTPNAVTAQAQSDLTAAYLVAAGAPTTSDLTGVDLGTFNAGNPLIPGVYSFSSTAALTGNLTLDGQGDPNAQWIFQIGSSLTTAVNATVSFINGASPCNVFWQVGESATIQTNNTFGGTIMALTSITLNGGTLNGRALARNGAVTISAAEFVNPICPAGPCVTVTKVADRAVAAVGEVITYTYNVCNCGPSTLTLNSLVDSRLGSLAVDFLAANGGSAMLAASDCTSFNKTYTVQATDPTPLVNTVIAIASSGGVTVTDTAQASVIITAPGPCVTLEKTANRTVVAVGEFITYTYRVCNCGVAPLTVNSVVDSRLGDLSADFVAANGGSAILGTGLCTSFNKVYTVLATDPSPLTNLATVTASSGGVTVTSSDTASVVITAPAAPCVTVVKTADRAVAMPGELITYTYTVCNCGAAPLTVNSVIDSRLGDLIADFVAANGGSAILPPAGCATFSSLYTVQATDTTPLVNTVIVIGNSAGVDVTDTDQASVIITIPGPCVTMLKTTDRTVAAVGDSVIYTFKVCNCGTAPLTVDSITDSRLGDLATDFLAANGGSSTIGTGLCVSFNKFYTVLSTDPSPLANVATVIASSGGTTVTGTDDASVVITTPAAPCITVVKTADRTVASPGELIAYTYTVCNCGAAPLMMNGIVDSRLGDLSALFLAANLGSSIVPVGACVTFSDIYMVSGYDTSPLVNTVTVSASSGGVVVTDTDQASVIITTPTPCVSIVKTADRTVASVGDVIIYTYKVCNCGTMPLTVDCVTDSILGELICEFKAANGGSATLAVGACATFIKSVTVQPSDPSPLTNSVFVKANSGGVVVTDTDQVSVTINPGRHCFLPVTLSQQNWHNFCASSPEIPGGLIYNNFPSAFAKYSFFGKWYSNQVIIGAPVNIITPGSHSITFIGKTSSLTQLCNFLPQTGPADRLWGSFLYPSYLLTRTGAKTSNVLAGEVLALTLNIAYNDMRLMPRTKGYDIEKFTLTQGILKGKTVGQVWNIANAVLSGTPPLTLGLMNTNALVSILQSINANYEFIDMNTFIDRGYLKPNVPLGQFVPPAHPMIVPF